MNTQTTSVRITTLLGSSMIGILFLAAFVWPHTSLASVSSVQTASSTIHASSTLVVTCPLITDYLKKGGTNNPVQVQKLQAFLKGSEKLDVDVTGQFDDRTEEAVKTFQKKYLSSILGPWDATRATGFVFITTQKKINELVCGSQPFKLSIDELAAIDEYKAAIATTAVEEVVRTEETPDSTSTSSDEDVSDIQTYNRPSVLSDFWHFVKNLF